MHCPASLSTLIAIDSSSDHFLIFKLCLVLQFIPHSLHLSCHPIICEFSNNLQIIVTFQIVRCPTSLSISLQLTHHQKFVIFFSILPCNISLSTFIAINLPSYHFLILKKCVIQHLFPQPLQLTHNLIICELSHISFHIHCNRLAIICEFSNCALSCISFHIDCN